MKVNTANRNTLWASIIVDELANNGIRRAIICPGSRSTPLAVACAEETRIDTYPVIDERLAAFVALGIGQASGHPAIVMTTSGTATANLYPAIIEANYSHVPLIVLTADRPHDLRYSGANQTIDQVKLYGHHVRWFVDVSPPQADPAPRTLRYLRTTVCRAIAAATGAGGGPVHLNIPFRKPLEPTHIEDGVMISVSEFAAGRDEAFTTITDAPPLLTDYTLHHLTEAILENPRGLIICGQLPSDAALHSIAGRLIEISQLTGYPILAEAHADIRFNSHLPATELVFGGCETFLRNEFAVYARPQLIIQFGSLPVGAALLTYLEKHPDTQRIQISDTGHWVDHTHLLSTLIRASSQQVIEQLYQALTDCDLSPDLHWMKLFHSAEQTTWAVVDEQPPHEGTILSDVIDILPDDANLFVANSNSIRHLDQFARPQPKDVFVYANRGASGIDGTLASALGVALESDHPTVLVLGDLALYHDLNSLHLIRRLNIPLVVVVINNDGGGIFHRLPIADYEPPFTALFQMPHGLTFAHAATMFDLPYTLATMGTDFRAAFKTALASGQSHLIEVPSNSADFEQTRRAIIEQVSDRLRPIIDTYKEHSKTQ